MPSAGFWGMTNEEIPNVECRVEGRGEGPCRALRVAGAWRAEGSLDGDAWLQWPIVFFSKHFIRHSGIWHSKFFRGFPHSVKIAHQFH
jgi:hypothetical protein